MTSVAGRRVVSVNVGLPRTVRWKRRDVTTSIFKEPVAGRIAVRRLNLDGDRQADLTVHGGGAKAVYAYPLEHYAFWQKELAEDLPFGAFGENLTVEGLPLEHEVAIGDRFRVGTAELVVTQPRLPCYKLGLRFDRSEMVKRFLASGRTGYYLAVEVEGEVAAGDPVETLAYHPARIAVAEITRVYSSDRDDLATIERLVALDALPDDWRNYFERTLAENGKPRHSWAREPRIRQPARADD
jgi:MOSC domain-containing protein YiiM